MTYWNLSSTFVGFTEVQAANQSLTLSTTSDTIVDIQIDGPPTGTLSNAALAPQALALSGSFKICDPTTGAVLPIGAQLAQNATYPTNPGSWFIRLIIPAQATATVVLVKSWGIFAIFSGGTF